MKSAASASASPRAMCGPTSIQPAEWAMNRAKAAAASAFSEQAMTWLNQPSQPPRKPKGWPRPSLAHDEQVGHGGAIGESRVVRVSQRRDRSARQDRKAARPGRIRLGSSAVDLDIAVKEVNV